MDNPSNELAIGSLVAERYRITKLLGTGGMGAVYLANDELLGGRELALKTLNTTMSADKEVVDRFLREIQLTVEISHPHIARSYDVGFMESKRPYFTMEYIKGKDIVEYLDAHPDPMSAAPRLLKQLCSALACIHEKGIIHRDIKPSNILVAENGNTFITDFGIARSHKSELTNQQAILGTYDFLAPEVWKNSHWTPQADLYCLGLTFYRAVSGRYAFEEAELPALLNAIFTTTPDAPRKINPAVPKYFSDIIMTLIEKELENRFKTAEEVVIALDKKQSIYNQETNTSSAKPTVPAFVPDRREKTKHKSSTGLRNSVLAAASIALVAGYLFVTKSEEAASFLPIALQNSTQGSPQMERVRAAEKKLENAPKDFALYKNAAELRELRGQNRAAASIYLKFLKREPEHKEALKSLVRIFQKSGENEKAESYLKKLEALA